MSFGRNILISLLITSNVYAGDCTLPERILKGASSPCDGYVFSNDNETKVRTQIATDEAIIGNLRSQNKVQEDMLKIDAQQIQIYNDKLNREQQLSSWEKALYFGMGALLTGAVAYGTVRTLK